MNRRCYTTAGKSEYLETDTLLLLPYVTAKKSREGASKAKSRFLIFERSSAIRQCYTTFLVKQGGERDE